MNISSLIFAAAVTLSAGIASAQGYTAEYVTDHNIDIQRMMPVRPCVQSGHSVKAHIPDAPRPDFELRGALINANSWPANSLRCPYGIYSATFSHGDASPIVNPLALDPLLNPATGAVMTPQGYMVIATTPYMGYYLVDRLMFDPNDWTLTLREAADMECMARSMTYNPADGKVYGCFANLDGSFSFSSLDLKTGARKKIVARMEQPYSAMAADSEGKLYAIDQEGSLFSVDIKTGEAQLLYGLNLPSAYTTSATFDPSTSKLLYVQTREDGSELFAIDPMDGTSLSYGTFPDGEQWTGIYVQPAEAEAGAPAAPAGLETDFQEGSLEGTLSFTIPEFLYCGANAEDETEWIVSVDGNESSSGVGMPGEAILVSLSVPSVGEHTLGVTLRNEAGMSPSVELRRYFGPDKPVIAERPVLKYSDGKVSLSWSLSSEGAAGGWIDPQAVRFDIVRYPGGETVAEKIEGTNWTQEVTIPETLTALSFGVIPVQESVRGQEVKSNSVALGNIALPYEVDFTQPASLDAFHIEDANADGVTWQRDEHGAFVDYSSITMNDWLISAPIEMKRGLVYSLTVDAWSQTVRHDERIAIWIGDGMETGAMKKRLTSRTLDGHPDPINLLITVEEDGLYHIGLQGISPAGQYILRLGSISIAAPVAQSAPDYPRFLSLEPDDKGALSMTGRVLVPIRASDGSSISSLKSLTVKRGDKTVATFSKPSPGQIVTFTDAPEVAGSYRYSAFAESEQGEGLTVSGDVRVGVNIPANPISVRVDGNILSWAPVHNGVDGLQLNTTDVDYHIFDKYFREIGSTADCSFELPEVAEDGYPEARLYYVCASTEAGENKAWTSPSLIDNINVSTDGEYAPINAEEYEGVIGLTFAGGLPAGRNPWKYVESLTETGSHPLEGSLHEGEEGAMIVLPGVSVSGDQPTFSFICKGISRQNVIVYVIDEGLLQPVPAEALQFVEYDGQLYVHTSLKDFTGHTVNAGVAICGVGEFTISDLRIDRQTPLFVVMESVTADALHTCGSVTVTAHLRNIGPDTSRSMSVLMEGTYDTPDGITTADFSEKKAVAPLKAGESVEVTFKLPLEQFHHEQLYATALLMDNHDVRWPSYAGKTQVKVADRQHPQVRNVEASFYPEANVVRVKWESPDGLDSSGTPVNVTASASLSGYKIYADKKLIGNQQAGFHAYTQLLPNDEPDAGKDVEYTVVACYGDEESLPADPAIVTITGVKAIEREEGSMRVSTIGSDLHIDGACGDVEVYNASGVCVARRTSSPSIVVSLDAGIYIITDGHSTLSVRL